MKRFVLLLASVFYLSGSDTGAPTPLTYRNEVILTVPHDEGPVKVTLVLEAKTYPKDNLIDVRLKIFHRNKLITQRLLEVFW